MPDAATVPDEQVYTPVPPSFGDVARQVATQEYVTTQRPIAEARREEASAREQDVLRQRGAAMRGPILETQAGLAKPMPSPPEVIKLPPPPTRQLHDFLAPVENEPPERSIMKFISALSMLGAGIGGLAKGDARASLAAMTGALTGWREGEVDRANRQFADWQAATDRLLKNAEVERQHYLDIMESKKLTNEQKIRAVQLAGLEFDNELMATSASKQDADAVIRDLTQMQNHLDAVAHQRAVLEMGYSTKMAQLQTQELIARERLDAMREATEQRAEAAEARLEAEKQWRSELADIQRERNDILRDRAEKGLLTPQQRAKLQQQDTGITQKLQQRERLKEAVAYLDNIGVIPKGPTYADRVKATINLQKQVGNPEVARHVEALNRWGTSLLMSSEISTAGGSAFMRIKSIAEKEAGNVQYVPKAFWDDFLDDSGRVLKEQQQNVRGILGAGTIVPETAPAEQRTINWSDIK